MELSINKRERNCAFFIFLMLLTSTDTVLFGTNGNQSFLYVSRAIGLLGFLILPLFRNTIGLDALKSKTLNLICSVLTFIILISSLINGDEWETTISKIIAVLAGYAISKSCSFYLFCNIFEKFVYSISIVAIVFCILSNFAPSLLHILPRVENTSGLNFYTILIGSIPIEGSYSSFIRSNGIFWEPGAFASYLLWNLMIQLFVLNNISFKRVLVSVITLFLTFSTTGFLTFAVIALAFIVNGTSKKADQQKIKRLIIYCIIAFFFLLIFAENSVLFDSVFGKIQGQGDELSGTAQTRFSSFFNGINAFLLNPFLGGGSHTDEMMAIIMNSANVNYESGGTMLTNTIISYFVSFGVFFGTIVLFGLVKFVMLFDIRKKVTFWLLLLALMMSYSSERFLSFMPFVFVFSGYKKSY